MFISKIRRGDINKFVSLLKKLLNGLVQPSPNLPINELLDDMTIKAVQHFKTQYYQRYQRLYTLQYDKDHLGEVTVGLWAMIGRALGKDMLLKELRETKDYEARSLLLGMDQINRVYTGFYTAAMEIYDAKIAAIFGGNNAVAAANGFDPDSLAIVKSTTNGMYAYYRGDTYESGEATSGHLSKQAMHLYGSTDRTRFGVDGNTFTDLYVPDGFLHPENVRKIPSPNSASVDFYYKNLGNYQDVTLMVSHIKDFKLQKVGNRWHIGTIGGKDGKDLHYIHSHLDLFKGNVGMTGKRIRLSFADAFC